MKKIYSLVIFLALVNVLFSQQSVISDNEFVINPYVISPSYSGFNGTHEIFANYINYFSGVKGAPNSAWVNYNGLIKPNFGIGASIRYEKFGTFRNIRGDVSAAYHLNIQSEHKLSVGLGFTVMQNSLDFSNSNSDPINDPALNNQNTKSGIGINAAFGITYAWKKLNISVSAPAIIPIKMSKLFLFSQPLHMRLYATYDISINRKWSVKPQVLVDYILHAPLNYNGIVSIKYDNLAWLNLGIGAQTIISAGAGFLVAQRFTLQYTFKYGLSGIAKAPYGNHEICLGVLVGKMKQSNINNSIFLRKYKSPYHEWE